LAAPSGAFAVKKEGSAMVFPSAAILAAAVTLVAQQVPEFSVDPSCRAAAREAASPDSLSVCRATEQKARANIVRQWS
jgi:hypothetical protein